MMRLRFLAVLGMVAITMPGLAQDTGRDASQPAQPRPAVARTPDGAAAEDLLKQVLRHYAAAPALRDALALTAAGQEAAASIAFDENGNVAMQMPGITATALDGRFYVVMDGIDEHYLDVPIETDVSTTWSNVFGPRSTLPFHLAARDTQVEVSAMLTGLGMGLVHQPQLAGVRMKKDEDGRTVFELRVDALNGEMLVHIDSETFLVVSSRVLVEAPPNAPASSGPLLVAQVRMKPVVSDTLDPPITFDPAGRTAVASPSELLAKRAFAARGQ